jgi:hypothetical protein
VVDIWSRTCPRCGRMLYKKHMLDKVICICGWIWRT